MHKIKPYPNENCIKLLPVESQRLYAIKCLWLIKHILEKETHLPQSVVHKVLNDIPLEKEEMWSFCDYPIFSVLDYPHINAVYDFIKAQSCAKGSEHMFYGSVGWCLLNHCSLHEDSAYTYEETRKLLWLYFNELMLPTETLIKSLGLDK